MSALNDRRALNAMHTVLYDGEGEAYVYDVHVDAFTDSDRAGLLARGLKVRGFRMIVGDESRVEGFRWVDCVMVFRMDYKKYE